MKITPAIRLPARVFMVKVTMAVMIALPALLGTQAFAAGPADGKDKSERIRHLLRINGFEKQMSQTPGTLKAQLRAQRGRTGLNQDMEAYVEEVVIEAFNPARILDRVVANLSEAGDQGWLRETLAFLTSPLGKRMTQYEINASGEESYRAMLQYGQGLKDNPPPKARVQLIHQINSAVKVFETSLDNAVNISIAIALALEASKPTKQLWDEEQFGEIKARVRKMLGERLRNIVFLSLLYTYRQASDGDIQRYIKFYRGEAGKNYVDRMNGAMGKAITALTWEAARKIKVKSML